MFLEWKEDRILIVPRVKKAPGSEKDKGAKVAGRKVGKVILKPGVNYVDDKFYKDIEATLEGKIKRGQIEVYTISKDGKKIPATIDLMETTQVKRLAKETYSLETVREMLKQAKSDEARTILRNRENELEKEYKKMGAKTEEAQSKESKSKTNKATQASAKVEME
jgi:glutamate synthase domain-containing protein 3